MRQRAILVALACAATLASGCADTFPDGNYHHLCATDADCDAPWMCLPWSPTTGGDTSLRCAAVCTTVAECPAVVTQHCGNGTVCVDGVCGFRPCR